MDLEANNLLGATTKLDFIRMGKTKSVSQKVIDVIESVEVLGSQIPRALIGFHNFAGADWDGKFVGIATERWIKLFLDLSNDDEVIQVFQQLENITLSINDFTNNELPSIVAPLEGFFCSAYSSKGYSPPEL